MYWIKRAYSSLLLILLISVAIRIAFAWDYIHPRPTRALATIPFLFEPGNIAYSLVQGKGYSNPFRMESGPTAWMTPVYPLILASLFKIFGPYTFGAFLGGVALNIAFSSLTCIPLFYIGKKLQNATLGATAAWLWTFFPNTILNTFESLWDACLGALLAALILWATLKLAETQRRGIWAAYGLLWGFTLMTNPTLISLLPLLIWAAYQQRQIKNVGLTVAVIVLCCVPWTIRNYQKLHSFVPLRSTLGLQIWIGNNNEAQGRWPGLLHPIDNSAERAKYLEQGEIAYMHEKLVEATDYMRSHVAEEVKLTKNRIVVMWTGGSVNPISDLFQHHSAWFRSVLIFNVVTAILMLAGMILLWTNRSRYAFPLSVFPLVFPWAYYLTVATPRYRLVIDPVVMLLSAFCLSKCSARLVRRKNAAVLLGLFILIAGVGRSYGQSLIVPIPTFQLSLPLSPWEDARGVAGAGSIEGLEQQAIIVKLKDGRFMVLQYSAETTMSDKKYKPGELIMFSAHISDHKLIADSIESLGRSVFSAAKSSVSPAPAVATIDPIILKTREQVNQYSKLLPDFTCEQTTRRYVRSPQKGAWFPLDIYSVEVLFSNGGGETYRDLKINGKHITKSLLEMGGSVSTGEFGSLLRSILRNAKPEDFQFVKTARVEKRPAREYAFRVAKERSDWEVASDYQFILPAYRGHIWIDAENGSVLRVERQADDIPPAFPIDKVQSMLEYGNVRLGTDGDARLLPVKAEMMGCQRDNGVCNRNEIAFDRYRNYKTDSKLIF